MFKIFFLTLLSIAAAVPMFGEENETQQNLVNNCWSHLTSLSDRLLCDQWLEESKKRSRISLKQDDFVKISNLPVIQEKKPLEFQSQPLENLSIKDTKKNELPPKSELKDITETAKLESPMNEVEHSKLSENHEKENIQPIEKPFIKIKNSRMPECNQGMQHKDKDINGKTILSNPYSILHHDIEEKEDLEEKSEPQNEDIPQFKSKKHKIKNQSENEILREAAQKKEEINDGIEEYWFFQQNLFMEYLSELSKNLEEKVDSISNVLEAINEHHLLEPTLIMRNLSILNGILSTGNLAYVKQLRQVLSGSIIARETFHHFVWLFFHNSDYDRTYLIELGRLLCELRKETVSSIPINDNSKLDKKGQKKSDYIKALRLVQDMKDGKCHLFDNPTKKYEWDLKFLLVLDYYEQYGTILEYLSAVAYRNRMSYFFMIDYLRNKGKDPLKAWAIEFTLVGQNFEEFVKDRPVWTTDAYREFGNLFYIPTIEAKEMLIHRFMLAIWSFNAHVAPFNAFLSHYKHNFEETIPFPVYLYHIVLSPNSLIGALKIVRDLPYSLKWERIEQLGSTSRSLNILPLPWKSQINLEAIRWHYFDALLETKNLHQDIIVKCQEIRQFINGKGEGCKLKASVQSWLMKYENDHHENLLEELIRKNMQLTQMLVDYEPTVVKKGSNKDKKFSSLGTIEVIIKSIE